MKKLFVEVLAAVAILAVILCAYAAGKTEGIRHALCDCEVFTVERYDPDNPEETARPDGTDQTIFFILDDEIYEHGMYQG